MKLPKQLLIASLTLTLSAWITTGWAQTCTITTSGGWNSRTCQETGSAPTAGVTIIIQAGVTVTTNSNNQVLHTGNVVVFGTLNINHNVRLNGSITVESGGQVNLNGKLELGPNTAGCGYSIIIKPGAEVDVGGTGSDRLSICGEDIMKGNGACNSCGGTNSATCPYNGQPYCEPTGGFTGPLGFDEDGYDGTLPVTLSRFIAQQKDNLIEISWATSKEEGFDYFLIQHSNNGNNFSDLASLPGAGYDTDTYKEYLYEHNNPVVGTNYYRLKAVDLDGSYEYFGPIAQIFSGARSVKVYPNPTKGDFINVDLNFNPSEGSRLAILNTQGVEVMNMTGIGPSNRITLNALTPGMYMLKFTSRELTGTRKFIVK
jgi:hypothetical protein